MLVLRVVIFLLWCHVDVHSQTVPYITFKEEILPNNSYVNLSQVGNIFGGGAGVQCHTNLTTCCTGLQGSDTGDWYGPDSDTRLPFFYENNAEALFQHHGDKIVYLYHSRRGVIQYGIYHCDIAVSGSSRGRLYVGLYETGGAGIFLSYSS